MRKFDLLLALTDRYASEFHDKYAHDRENIYRALLIGEDIRGQRHSGIDYYSIVRAIARSPAEGRICGLSTVAQQYVRTIFPRGPRNFLLAKLSELLLARKIHRQREREAIWAAYLMCAYYGSRAKGYGAIRALFADDRSPITRENAAAIVACLKYPRPSRAQGAWQLKHVRRVRYILDRWDQVSL